MHPTLAVFGAIDWTIIGLYLALMLGIGAWSYRRGEDESPESFFLGGRRMPPWAVSLSVLATALSAATFVGAPAEAFSGNLSYLILNVGGVLAAVVVAFLFVPAFYEAGTVTIYGYLGQRIGPGAGTAASIAFLLGRLLASGARLFIAGIVFALMLYGDTELPQVLGAVLLFGAVGTAYTAFGGIRAVIWTDAIQIVIVIGAAVLAAILLLKVIPAPLSAIWQALSVPEENGGSKLGLVDLSLDFSRPYTLWAALAMTFFNVAAYGTDQDLAQRLLTCRGKWRGSWSLIGAILAGLPITLLFMLVGLLLWVFYSRPDLMGDAMPADPLADPRRVYPQFLLNHLPTGLAGLAMAGLFAASMSSLDSAINAMASSAVVDLGITRQGGGRVHSRAVVVVMGIGLTLAACGLALLQEQGEQTLLPFALSVMTFAYAGLLGVFLTALFTRRGSTRSVIAALFAGAGVVTVCRFLPDLTKYFLGEPFRLAFPWWMVIGAVVSFGVCIIGRRDRARVANAATPH